MTIVVCGIVHRLIRDDPILNCSWAECSALVATNVTRPGVAESVDRGKYGN